ncbi:NAD-dependent epimerase/dehydratase family protein [Frigoribacterium sp. ACAM 257]|uniref:NAD-dependent epimerase/dehydratase family protein n=1 Tax=Frigoribacterium sp. ACAM 257 TaxID=2508998 RepID=UPI0011BA4336|nr:NAD-dependent epimerase/dehydratase family protein [Frigoribacterium sp. ACAM 257]TWX38480.1 NAD-dependent epimerase/dehydratase family protein [Frigoribacterium sp. ACAM 257]
MRKVLVLGGTGWLGHEIARQAVADGAEVTCLARGSAGGAPDGAALVRSDRTRPGAYDAVARADHEWDEVVELATAPDLVGGALAALATRARHWTLISSVSVHARDDEPGADESAELVAVGERPAPDDYAQQKAWAERTSAARLGDRLLVVRPSLVVGPGDPSDRFGTWPARMLRGGRVLVPTTEARWVQVIDVADLAAWVVLAGRDRLLGPVTAAGEPLPLAEVLEEARLAAGTDPELVPVDDAWLLEHDVRWWAGPRSLPMWLPLEASGFARRGTAAFRAAGGTARPLAETMRRVRDDELARGVDRPRRSGLAPDEEAALLRELVR